MTEESTQDKKLLTRDEVAAEYGLGKRFLELAAWRKEGPPFYRIGHRTVRYRREDVEKWLRDCMVAHDK